MAGGKALALRNLKLAFAPRSLRKHTPLDLRKSTRTFFLTIVRTFENPNNFQQPPRCKIFTLRLIDSQHANRILGLFQRQTARRFMSTSSARASLSQRRTTTSQRTTTLTPRTSTSSRPASLLPPAAMSRLSSHGNTTTTLSLLRVSTTSANGFTSPPRSSPLPTSSNNDPTLLLVE